MALGGERGLSMAFLCRPRHCKMMRRFYSQSDLSANTAFLFRSNVSLLPALRIAVVAQKKVAVPPGWNRKRPKTSSSLISLLLASRRTLVRMSKAVMCHAWTDISSKQINAKICPYCHPGKKPSEWTKAERPSGAELSLPVSSSQLVRALMCADLAADEVDSLR